MASCWWNEFAFFGNVSDEMQLEETGIQEATSKYACGFRIMALICSLIMIACSVMGAFGNAMSLLIFSRLSMRRLSVNVLLTGLSSVDLTIVILTIPVFAIHGLNDFFLDRKLYENFYSVVVVVLYPLSMIAQTCSIWTFVLISIERYYAVCKPLVVKRLLTVKRAMAGQLVLFLLGIAYNGVRFFEYAWSDEVENGYYRENLRSNKLYFVAYFTTSYLLTQFLIPFLIIATLNILILRQLRRARHERRRLSHAQQEQCRTTRMIVVVTVMFVACNSLPFMMNFFEAFDSHLFKNSNQDRTENDVVEPNPNDLISVTWDGYSIPSTTDDSSALKRSIAYLVMDISNTLVVVNAASTFIVYLIYCRRYRTLFWKYCSYFYTRHRRRDRRQSPPGNSSNWSSYVVRPYSASFDNCSTLTTNELRPHCKKYSSTLRRATTTSMLKCPELEKLNTQTSRASSIVNVTTRAGNDCCDGLLQVNSSTKRTSHVQSRAPIYFASTSDILFD